MNEVTLGALRFDLSPRRAVLFERRRAGLSAARATALALGCLVFCGCSSDSDPAMTPSQPSGEGASGGATMGANPESSAPPKASPEEAAPAPRSEAEVCASALFCDDFEAQVLGRAPAGGFRANQNADGRVTVEADRTYRGGQALKATTVASEAGYKVAFAAFSDSSVLPADGNALYGRMMFFLDSVPDSEIHWTFVDGAGATEEGYQALYRYGGQRVVLDDEGQFVGNQLMANYETPGFYSTPPSGPDTDCYQHAEGAVAPVGRWACVEWYFDGGANEMRLWVDSEEVSGARVEATGQGCRSEGSDYVWEAPVFDTVHVGWESYQPDDQDRSIWIDDFVLSETRIGCPAPAP